MRTTQQDVPPKAPVIRYGTFGGAGGGIADAGSGDWTTARTALGVYTVTFNKPFAAAPIIVVSPYYGGGGASCQIQARSGSGFTAASFQFSPYSAVDSNIMFVAFGFVK